MTSCLQATNLDRHRQAGSFTYLSHTKLNMTALLVIDMQRHFTTSAAPITANVNLLIDHFHSDDLTVVYTQHGHTPAQLSGAEVSQLVPFWGPDGSIHRFAESWHLLPDLLPPATSDVQVQDKDTYDAFIHTGLEETLRARRIERVVVCGVLTNFCCEWPITCHTQPASLRARKRLT